MFSVLLVALSVVQGTETSAESRALARAAETGDAHAIRELLSGSDALDPDSRLRGSFTALMLAADAGHLDACRVLVELGANPRLGNTVLNPLILAATRGHADVVRLLADNGADVDTVGRTGWSALAEALVGDRDEVVDVLLQAGASPIVSIGIMRKEPIVIAASRGRVDILMKLLRDEIASDDAVVTAALINAAWNGHEAVVKLLLDRGVDPSVRDRFGRSASSAANGAGRESIQAMLERAGASSETASLPILEASRRGQASVLDALIDAGANVDARDPVGTTPLMAAVRAKENYRALRTLLVGGASVDAVDDGGRTALMWAAAAGETRYVRALLEYGANPDKRDRSGKTAKDHADGARHEGTARLLASWTER